MLNDILLQYGYYGFLSIGAISMLVLTILRRHQYQLSIVVSFLFPFILLIVGVSGAKLLYFIESSFTSFDGMSFFGAVYLVMILMPLAGMLFRLKPTESLDICAPCVASIIGFMRFGCFCAGCCGGTICKIGSYAFRWPTQILEGLGDMLILSYLLQLEYKDSRSGKLYPMFLLTYGVMRFFIEFLRESPKNMVGFSEGQWLAVLSVIIGAISISALKKGKKPNECSA